MNGTSIPRSAVRVRYATYLEEVMQLAEDELFENGGRSVRRGIAGWSMGGHGAPRFAQSHPRKFSALASIIGLLDFPRTPDLPEGQNYKVPEARFGGNPME